MATLIVDIETAGEEWEQLAPAVQASLMRFASRPVHTAQQQEALKEEVKNTLGLSPFTGKIAALACFEPERNEGVVYYHTTALGTSSYGAYTLSPHTEQDMLRRFWERAASCDRVVTYNGRRFDVPFLCIRSAACGIRPSVSLLRHRYTERQTPPMHIDLLDQLTGYGALPRRPSLSVACRAFGILPPWQSSQPRGEHIARLLAQGECEAVATHAADNARAVAALYNVWCTFLSPL